MASEADTAPAGERIMTTPNETHPTAFAVTLMEHLVVPTFVLDAEQRVIVWNRACERLTGIPASQVMGR